MTHEQREEYIRQAKKQFQNHPDNRRKSDSYSSGKTYKSYEDTEVKNEKPLGFWKVRLLIAVLLFVGIFSLKQTNSEDSPISHEKITAMIEKDVDMQTVQAWFEQ